MPLLDAAPYLALLATPRKKQARDWKQVPAAASAGTAELTLETQRTIQEVLIHVDDGTNDWTESDFSTMVDEIRLVLDGRIVDRITGDAAAMQAEFYQPGIIANGNLPLYYGIRPWLESIANQEALAYGLNGIETAKIELVLNATHDASNVKAYIRDTVGTPLGAHVERLKLGKSFGSSGSVTFDDFPFDPTGRHELLALHLKCTVANVTDVELLANSVPIVKGTPDEIHGWALDYGREIQSGWLHLDFSENKLINGLPLNPLTMELNLETSSALGNVEIVAEVAKYPQDRQTRLAEAQRAA